jgi:hypothetical protein
MFMISNKEVFVVEKFQGQGEASSRNFIYVTGTDFANLGQTFIVLNQRRSPYPLLELLNITCKYLTTMNYL